MLPVHTLYIAYRLGARTASVSELYSSPHRLHCTSIIFPSKLFCTCHHRASLCIPYHDDPSEMAQNSVGGSRAALRVCVWVYTTKPKGPKPYDRICSLISLARRRLRADHSPQAG
jgi:hypothetical protein